MKNIRDKLVAKNAIKRHKKSMPFPFGKKVPSSQFKGYFDVN